MVRITNQDGGEKTTTGKIIVRGFLVVILALIAYTMFTDDGKQRLQDGINAVNDFTAVETE